MFERLALRVIPLLAVSSICATCSAGLELVGDYIRVGINDSGTLIVDDGLGNLTGLQFDPAGTGSFAMDFLTAGVALDFMSLSTPDIWATASLLDGNTFGAVTSDESSGSILAARSTGSWVDLGYGVDIGINQLTWFEASSPTIHVELALTNNGTDGIFDLYFARGLDPDPDATVYGDASTLNATGPAWVSATGPHSGYRLRMIDGTGMAVGSVDSLWFQDPFALIIPHNDGDGDYTTNLAWQSPLNAGETWNLQYDIDLAQVAIPEPATATTALFGTALLWFVARRSRRYV